MSLNNLAADLGLLDGKPVNHDYQNSGQGKKLVYNAKTKSFVEKPTTQSTKIELKPKTRNSNYVSSKAYRSKMVKEMEEYLKPVKLPEKYEPEALSANQSEDYNAKYVPKQEINYGNIESDYKAAGYESAEAYRKAWDDYYKQLAEYEEYQKQQQLITEKAENYEPETAEIKRETEEMIKTVEKQSSNNRKRKNGVKLKVKETKRIKQINYSDSSSSSDNESEKSSDSDDSSRQYESSSSSEEEDNHRLLQAPNASNANFKKLKKKVIKIKQSEDPLLKLLEQEQKRKIKSSHQRIKKEAQSKRKDDSLFYGGTNQSQQNYSSAYAAGSYEAIYRDYTRGVSYNNGGVRVRGVIKSHDCLTKFLINTAHVISVLIFSNSIDISGKI